MAQGTYHADRSPISKAERLAAQIIELHKRTTLESWSAYIRDMQVPGDLYPALMTQRPQLMPKGRAMTAEETQVLYNIIGTLIDTNAALRDHTQQTAILVTSWVEHFKGMFSLAQNIDNFANLRLPEDSAEDDEYAGMRAMDKAASGVPV